MSDFGENLNIGEENNDVFPPNENVLPSTANEDSLSDQDEEKDHGPSGSDWIKMPRMTLEAVNFNDDWESFKDDFEVHMQLCGVDITKQRYESDSKMRTKAYVQKSLWVYQKLKQIKCNKAEVKAVIRHELMTNNPKKDGFLGWQRLQEKFDPNTVTRRQHRFVNSLFVQATDTSLQGLDKYLSTTSQLDHQNTSYKLDLWTTLALIRLAYIKATWPDVCDHAISLELKAGTEGFTGQAYYKHVQKSLSIFAENKVRGETQKTFLAGRSGGGPRGNGKGKGNGRGNGKGSGKGKNGAKGIKCYTCGKPGHKSPECTWCKHCKMANHTTEECRKKKQGESPLGTRPNFATGGGLSGLAMQATMGNFAATNPCFANPSIFGLDSTTKVCLDTGAAKTLVNQEVLFRDLRPTTASVEVSNGDTVSMNGIGTAVIPLVTLEGHKVQLVIKDAHYYADSPCTLLSFHDLALQGFRIGEQTTASIDVVDPLGVRKNDALRFRRDPRLGVYLTDLAPQKASKKSFASVHANDAAMLHRRLGHASAKRIKATLKNTVHKYPDAFIPPQECLVCAQANIPCASNPNAQHAPRATGPCQVAALDVAGPFHESNGYKYSLNAVDLYSGAVYAILLKGLTAGEISTALSDFRRRWLTPDMASDRRCTLYLDSMASFRAELFHKTLKGFNWDVRLCCPNAHAGHPVERHNRTLLDLMRLLLLDAGMPLSHWSYAYLHGAYLYNRTSPSKGGPTPYERHTGKQPAIHHVRRFGSLVFVKKSDRHPKADFQGEPGIFLGIDPIYAFGTVMVRVLRTNRIIHTNTVKFVESTNGFGFQFPPQDQMTGWEDFVVDDDDSAPDHASESNATTPAEPAPSGGGTTDSPGSNQAQPSSPQTPAPSDSNVASEDTTSGGEDTSSTSDASQDDAATAPAPPPLQVVDGNLQCPQGHDLQLFKSVRRSANCDAPGCVRVIPRGHFALGCKQCEYDLCDDCSRDETLDDVSPLLFSGVTFCQPITPVYSARHVIVDEGTAKELPVPSSYRELLRLPGPHREIWLRAMLEEITNLLDSGALEPIRMTEVEKLKAQHKITLMGTKWIHKLKKPSNRVKSRLVSQGFNEIVGTYDTYSPTVEKTTIRVACTVALTRGWSQTTFDCTAAFLEAKVEEPIFIKSPPGFIELLKHGSLKEFPTTDMAFRLRKSLYGLKSAPRRWFLHYTDIIKKHTGLTQSKHDAAMFYSDELIALIHVDDTKVFGKKESISSFIEEIKRHLNITELEEDAQYLGTEWEYNPKQKTCKITQQHYLTEVLKSEGMQDAKPVNLPMNSGEMPKPLDKPSQHPGYREIVGKLIYALETRPDLSFVVHALARSMHANGKNHYGLAKRVLRYIQGCTDLGITLRGEEEMNRLAVTVASDASYANQADMKSTTGFVVYLGRSPVTWGTRKQSLVTLSSQAAELVAMTTGVEEARYVQLLALELGARNPEPIHVRTDNQPSIDLLHRDGDTKRARALNIRIHRIRDLLRSKLIKVQYLCTNDMPADALTKQLSRAAFEKHIKTLTAAY